MASKEWILDLGSMMDGCLWDWYESTDFLLTEADIYTLPELYTQDTIRYNYNQWKQDWSKKSCSIFAAVWAMSDLKNYKFSLDEIKEIDDESYKRGRVQGQGWYTKNAFALTCERRNKHFPEDPAAYYAVLFSNDEKCNMVMEKNYNLGVSFNYTADYVADYWENWEIDRAKSGQKKLIGHCVNEIIKDERKQTKDNYDWSKSQYVKINVSNADLYKAWIYHTWAYLFTNVKEDNIGEVKRLEKVKTACLNALEYNSQLWNATNDSNTKKRLHDMNEWIRNNNLKYIEENLAKLR